MLFKKINGFTLMETIVVIGLISLILPIIFSIIFSITRHQARVYVLSTVKREGDNALSIIENKLRNNAVSIFSDQALLNQVCTSLDYDGGDGTSFYISDKTGQWFKFSLSNYEIASSSSIPNSSQNLTSSSNTRITSFNINCQQTSTFTQPVVGIAFTIEQKQSQSQRVEDIASLNYSTKIKLH